MVKVGYAAGMASIMPGISTAETATLNAFMAGTPLVDSALSFPVLKISFAVMKDPLFGNVGDTMVWIISREVDVAINNFTNRAPRVTKKMESSLLFNARKSDVISDVEI